MSFSKYIKELRASEGITQAELADILKISPTAVVNIEASRTTYPRHDVFKNLTKYVVDKLHRDTMFSISYNILFNNEEEDYGIHIPSHYKNYLAYIWTFDYNIDINDVYKIDPKNQIFNGVVWRAGLNYYKTAIVEYNREKFIKVINNTKPEELKLELEKLIYVESNILNKMDNTKNIKEIRFVLDANNKDDQLVFKTIQKINMPNYGKIADISFEFFDTKSSKLDIKNRFYVTNRISRIGV